MGGDGIFFVPLSILSFFSMAPIQYNRGFNEIDARQMEEWLLDKHLHHYTATLTRNGVCCLDDLALLSSEDLTNMGITSIGARRKLLCYIAQLQGETTPRGGPEAADEVEWQSRAAVCVKMSNFYQSFFPPSKTPGGDLPMTVTPPVTSKPGTIFFAFFFAIFSPYGLFLGL